MFRLLKIELKKIIPYKPGWIFFILYALVLPAILSTVGKTRVNGGMIDIAKMFTFPDIWPNLTFLTSYLHLIPGLFIIMLMSNEYSYKTLRQSVINGQSKIEFLLGKILLIVFISLVLTTYLLIVGLIYGVIHTPEISMDAIFGKVYFAGLYGFQTFAYGLMAFLFAVLIKRSAISMIIYMFYVWIIERGVRSQLPDSIQTYFPANTFSDLIPFPGKGLALLFGMQWTEHSLSTSIPLTLLYCLLFCFLAFYILKKRDI